MGFNGLAIVAPGRITPITPTDTILNLVCDSRTCIRISVIIPEPACQHATLSPVKSRIRCTASGEIYHYRRTEKSPRNHQGMEVGLNSCLHLHFHLLALFHSPALPPESAGSIISSATPHSGPGTHVSSDALQKRNPHAVHRIL